MTQIELRFYETMIYAIQDIAKELKRLNDNLEKMNQENKDSEKANND